VNSRGERVVLHGVDRAGAEYKCVQGTGIWAGPMDQASVTAMKGWGINAVRIPLNEACWDGQSYVKAADRGASYRQAVQDYVQLLNRNGMVAILDLHLTDGAYDGPFAQCKSPLAVCEKPMPDAANATGFWHSVAQWFRGNGAVIFDLFNEPYPQPVGTSETAAWQCWLHGGTCAGIGYQVAGMQALVNAVRAAGAHNVIMIGGIHWAGDLAQWLTYEPRDPDHDLAASWHSYEGQPCATPACWNSEVAPVAAKVPLIAGEIGDKDCSGRYIGPLMSWLDSRAASYLAWAWNTKFGCSSGPSLISSYAGTPTPYGAAYRSHLLALARQPGH
jgi:endoglucanase